MNKQLKEHIINLINKDTRLDGRGFLDYREPITVEYDISNSAEGSAKVTMGETIVIAGIKMAAESPYPDTPNKGSLMVGAELMPLSNPDFEPGPPSIQAIELGRVIDRGIRESGAVDFEKLCIKEGEKVWIVIVDLCIINDAGNLFDAAGLAAMAALKNTKFPALSDDFVVDYKTKTDQTLPLLKAPIPITINKISNQFIIDPLSEEESVVDARLTVTTTTDGTLCALQKGGDNPLSAEEIDKMVEIGIEKAAELRKLL